MNNGDFVCTSPNDGTHYFRPVSARAQTFWQSQNFNRFVIDNNEDYYIVKSVDSKKFVMRLEKIIWILLVSLSLTNCANINRSEVGATLGTVTTTGMCVEMGVTDPYLIAGCAVTGAFAAEIMYKSDYDVHNAVFVDHLNTWSRYTKLYKLV